MVGMCLLSVTRSRAFELVLLSDGYEGHDESGPVHARIHNAVDSTILPKRLAAITSSLV
jgi:hypothetical protein